MKIFNSKYSLRISVLPDTLLGLVDIKIAYVWFHSLCHKQWLHFLMKFIFAFLFIDSDSNDKQVPKVGHSHISLELMFLML